MTRSAQRRDDRLIASAAAEASVVAHRIAITA